MNQVELKSNQLLCQGIQRHIQEHAQIAKNGSRNIDWKQN